MGYYIVQNIHNTFFRLLILIYIFEFYSHEARVAAEVSRADLAVEDTGVALHVLTERDARLVELVTVLQNTYFTNLKLTPHG